MALFTGQRDASLVRTLNKELVNDIIDTEVYYYKIILDETKINLYGEGKNKVYYNPIKIPTLIDRQQAEFEFEEFGSDYKRSVNFNFLRDTLADVNVYPEVGDVIEWNNEHHIVDTVLKNQYFGGKNPETWDGGEGHGYDVSIICETHVAIKSQLSLVGGLRTGINKENNDLPLGI